MKRRTTLQATLTCLTLAFFLSASPALAAKVNVQFAHSGSLEHQYQIGAEYFKQLVEDQSGGDVTVTIFPQAQLGSEREAAEGVRMNTINMTVIAAGGALPNWVPQLQVLGLPYLFQTREQVYSVLDGPFGEKLSAMMLDKGFRNLAFWEIGFRNFSNGRRPVASPADMAGLKIRVQESRIWMEFIKKLGGIPTPVPFGELYTALQQGVVDGQENPVATIHSMKFYEVQKHLTLDRHTYEAAAVLVNPAWFDTLSEEHRDILTRAAVETARYQRAVLAEKEAQQLADIEAHGVEVVENPDRQAFAEAVKDLPGLVADSVPAELVEELRTEIAKIQ